MKRKWMFVLASLCTGCVDFSGYSLASSAVPPADGGGAEIDAARRGAACGTSRCPPSTVPLDTASSACGPQNCDGCCVGNTCVVGTQNDACGRGGSVCTACNGLSCEAGSCVSPASSIVLFGGDANGRLSDTWEWDGAEWTERDIEGPSGRSAHAMARLGKKVILFGGDDGPSYLGDTWEYDGKSWRKRDIQGPTPRSHAAMASFGDRVVLFGGFDGKKRLGDTWEYDGKSWTRRATDNGPLGRREHVMATIGNRVVMFGGSGIGGSDLNDTWEWNGATWKRADVTGPRWRYGHIATAVPSRGRLVMLGGWLSRPDTDTWEWDGRAWNNKAGMPAGATSLTGAAMAALGSSALLVLGKETWEWNGAAWKNRNVAGPPERTSHAMAVR